MATVLHIVLHSFPYEMEFHSILTPTWLSKIGNIRNNGNDTKDENSPMRFG